MLTKQKSLVSFCAFLVVLQFINLQLSPWVYAHEHAKYLWYITWMVTDLSILFFVGYRAVFKGTVTKEELAISCFTLIAIIFHISRFIERHYSELTVIKDTQAYAYTAVNVCILLILFAPIAKQLVVVAGKQINGITLFGLRFSVSSVNNNSSVSNSKNFSRRKRRRIP
ncbi:hypothetical protein [Kangiella marina]|uniref:hypothetical protein n=1 Tax=Kangiella marina TaxID=1079178 RepID=UPI0031E66A97